MSKYSDQVREDARKAADYIREHGWCQGLYVRRDGACCAVGAMKMVSTYGSRDLAYAFQSSVDNYPTDWNDTPGRTKEEVLAVFDTIANS